MNKALLFGLWTVSVTATLVVSFVLIILGPVHTKGEVRGVATASNVEVKSTYHLFTAVPTMQNNIEQSVTVTDARVEIIRQFLHRYKSPLEPFALELVETADQHNLDFRLIPAIAMQESNLCLKIPQDSHNCWGYGIYGEQVLTFPSYKEAIETVGKGLSKNYVYQGLSTPELIMNRYTPSSNGSWAASVRHFMEEME